MNDTTNIPKKRKIKILTLNLKPHIGMREKYSIVTWIMEKGE